MWSFGNVECCKSASSFWGRGLVPMLVAASTFGCGGSSPKPAPVAAQPSAATAPAKAERAAPQQAEKAPTKRKQDDDEIPLNAFFDNPLEVAANSTVVGGAAPGSKEPAAGGPAATEKPMADPEKPAATGGAMAWNDFLPMESLLNEVKKVQNRLKASLQNPGTYNGNYKDIAADGAVIAAIAEITCEHSEDIKWKANAPLIRDFGYEMSQAASGLGKDNFEKTKAAFEKIESVLSGSIPPGAPNAAPKRPFSEVADRGGLMKRIEKARNYMRDNINVEAKLKAEADSVLHEAMIISTLGKVVSFEDYSSADEADYHGFAEALIDGARETATAVKDQSFKKFTDSMNKVNKSCDQCHANYGNG